MKYQDISNNQRKGFNESVSHPLQSFEWGEFREKTGLKVIRRGVVKENKIEMAYQMTIHKIPGLKMNIGYLPKGYLPTNDLLADLKEIGKIENCAYIQLEPNVERNNEENNLKNLGLMPSFRPLFPKYTFVLDLEPAEEELLKKFHQKTRYNIRVAQKHGVEITEDDTQKGFEDYLKLVEETTKRQRFYAHSRKYQEFLWETLKNKKNGLRAHLFLAKYKNKTLAAWMLFIFGDTLYYPYGASSSENRETMASNLMMWEAIRFGKKQGLSKFDMWGSLGPDADKNDPWYGFHRFKEGYAPRLVEFVGDYDYVLNPSLYTLLKIGDKARWAYLRARKFI
jgi:lipid II:glycine glycyltransferase (peptidoglycan interpeptide bridge formation enzyme)